MSTYIITNSESSGQPATQYISGFSGSDSLLIYSLGDFQQDKLYQLEPMEWAYLFVDGRYWEQAEKEVNEKKIKLQIVKITREYTTKQALQDVVAKHRFKECILDSRITPYSSVIALQDAGLVIHARPDWYAKLREIKMDQELTYIQKAQSIALAAYTQLAPEIQPGVREQYIAAKLEFIMKQEGAEKAAFETIVASGENSVLPHARATDRLITETDSVIIDFGCVYKGYCCDFTRTILMPKASEKLHEIYGVVHEAQQKALNIAKKGIMLKDIDMTARLIIEQKGYGPAFTHATGHGVGMAVHELPHVSSVAEGVLQRGHVITIEPGIYVTGVGGVRLEEMVLV